MSHPPFQAALGAALQWFFPSLSLGLACYLVVLEGLSIATRNKVFRGLYDFWILVFGVCLVLGIAAVLMLGRSTGWDWTGMQMSAAVVAPAGLAAALLQRRAQTGEAAHFALTALLAASLLAILLWVVALHGQAQAAAEAYYVRLVHTANAAFLITALAVGAASAWRLLRRPGEETSGVALRMAVGTLAIAATLGVLAGAPPADATAGRVPAAALDSHIAVGLGVAMICLALWAGWLAWRRGGPERSRPFLRTCLAMSAVSLLAAFAGWILGPLSPGGETPAPAVNVALWTAYALLFGVGGAVIFVLVRRGLDETGDSPPPPGGTAGGRRPAR